MLQYFRNQKRDLNKMRLYTDNSSNTLTKIKCQKTLFARIVLKVLFEVLIPRKVSTNMNDI